MLVAICTSRPPCKKDEKARIFTADRQSYGESRSIPLARENTQVASGQPRSMLLVCIGNTCRGPMAEELAKRRWPTTQIKSVGVKATARSAATEAIVVMRDHFQADISQHKPLSIADVDPRGYEIVVCLEKRKLAHLTNGYTPPLEKVIDLHVDDPEGTDLQTYLECAERIDTRLMELQQLLERA